MTRTLRLIVLLAGAAILGPVAFAQAPAKQATPAPAPAPGPTPAPTPQLPSPPPNYVYAPEGRRDPFVDLLNRGTEPRKGAAAAAKRPEGVAGLQTNEIAVKGLVRSKGAWMAMVSGPDNKVYTLRPGDRLLDGVVRSVDAQSVVILQDVNDPLSLEKQREVRKFLRGREEVK